MRGDLGGLSTALVLLGAGGSCTVPSFWCQHIAFSPGSSEAATGFFILFVSCP